MPADPHSPKTAAPQHWSTHLILASTPADHSILAREVLHTSQDPPHSRGQLTCWQIRLTEPFHAVVHLVIPICRIAFCSRSLLPFVGYQLLDSDQGWTVTRGGKQLTHWRDELRRPATQQLVCFLKVQVRQTFAARPKC